MTGTTNQSLGDHSQLFFQWNYGIALNENIFSQENGFYALDLKKTNFCDLRSRTFENYKGVLGFQG